MGTSEIVQLCELLSLSDEGSGGSVGKILARTEQAIIPIVQLQGQVSIDSMRPADSNVKRDANIKVCNPEARGRDMVMDGVEAYSDNLPVVSYQDPNKYNELERDPSSDAKHNVQKWK
ncbi:hypothetical protein Q3G72_030677 [Acer saccharum]|nr:hypothetical protein Q3G72_030677 [Acer saccharum]